jgi:REP element-mobilizing transposase RayT
MSTYLALNVHLVFSTKWRKPWIDERWAARLHRYLGGTLKAKGAVPLEIGGVADHVHLLFGCKATHRVCDLVRDLKRNATAWVQEEIGFPPFAWQDGYALFSISPAACQKVAAYIRRQPEHHRTRSFREELTAMLERAHIAFDAKYLD